MSKSLIDEIGRARAEELMTGAVQEAVQKANDLGLPQVVLVDGAWVKRYPDGRIEPIEQEG